jgi:hypothetical protein
MRIRPIFPAAVAGLLAALALTPLTGSAATVPPLPGQLARPVVVPTVSTPAATTPSVTVPPVTTPAVTTPPVTTPAVTTPSTTPVSTPSLHAPTVHVPSVTVPGVKTPQSSTPSLNTPGVSTPSDPSGSNSGQSGQPTGSPTTRASTSNSGSTSVAAGARTGLAKIAHRAKRGPSRPSSAGAAIENRRLRGLVTRLHGCLGSLTTQSRRLLSLRAGLNGAPRSASAVARVLHVSLQREGLLEQLSLIELQTSTSGGCAGASAVRTPIYERIASQLTPSAPWLPISAANSSPAPASRAASAASARGPSPTQAPAVISVPSANRIVERASADSQSLPSAAIVLLAVLALAITLLVLPATRRQLLRASGLSGAPARDPGSSQAGASAGLAAASWAARSESKPSAPATATVIAGPEPESMSKPEPHNPLVQPDPEVTAATSPELRPPSDLAAPRPAPVGGWAREHAAQAALVVTVIAGGAVRLLGRGRRSRR